MLYRLSFCFFISPFLMAAQAPSLVFDRIPEYYQLCKGFYKVAYVVGGNVSAIWVSGTITPQEAVLEAEGAANKKGGEVMLLSIGGGTKAVDKKDHDTPFADLAKLAAYKSELSGDHHLTLEDRSKFLQNEVLYDVSIATQLAFMKIGDNPSVKMPMNLLVGDARSLNYYRASFLNSGKFIFYYNIILGSHPHVLYAVTGGSARKEPAHHNNRFSLEMINETVPEGDQAFLIEYQPSENRYTSLLLTKEQLGELIKGALPRPVAAAHGPLSPSQFALTDSGPTASTVDPRTKENATSPLLGYRLSLMASILAALIPHLKNKKPKNPTRPKRSKSVASSSTTETKAPF